METVIPPDMMLKLDKAVDHFLKLVELESESSISLTIVARHGKLTGTEVKINKGWQ